MTPLRHQIIEEMQLRGYAQSTIEGYVHSVAQLARHHRRSPRGRRRQSCLRARAARSAALSGSRFQTAQSPRTAWRRRGAHFVVESGAESKRVAPEDRHERLGKPD